MRRTLVLTLLPIVAACAAQPENQAPATTRTARPASDSAYFAMRDSASRSLDARAIESDTTVSHADSAALLHLEPYLRRLIGAVYVLGFDDRGRINLATLFPGDESSGLADGLVYESTDRHARLFVTTQTLFAAWRRARFAKDTNATGDPIAALSREETYTPIFESDAAVVRYADLPVTARGKRVFAAMLANRAQDICLTCRPGRLLIGVRAGHRIFVVDAAARDTIEVPASCRKTASADTRADSAIAAYQRGGNDDSVRFAKYTTAEDRRFANLRRCYDETIRSDPRFADLVAQARTLIEALPRH